MPRFFRRRFIRRTGFRRRRVFRRRFNLRRIQRVMRRRPKPELKWVSISSLNTAIVPHAGTDADPHTVFQLTPSQILPGEARSERSGNRVNYHNFLVEIWGDTTVNGAGGAPLINTYRFLLVSGRVSVLATTNALRVTSLVSSLDFNNYHVYFDRVVQLANPVTDTTGRPSTYHVKKLIRFPRKVVFASGSDDVLNVKDHVYLVVVNPLGSASNFSLNLKMRLSFTDV